MIDSTTRFDPIPETCSEALAKWDKGEPVFTVEMGGLGPGYEQCIQMLAFELIREFKDDKTFDKEGWNGERAEKIVDTLDKKLGFSGAQVGAAKSLASFVCSKGYRKALRMSKVKDRLIQVSKRFPQ